MLEIIAVLALISALILLYVLSVIDLKIRLLPNELVAGFFCAGAVFHGVTFFHYLPPADMAIGALIGAGSLLFIRTLANYFYQTDTLGLGDVKLMGAAGLWLGPYFILIALTFGALAGVLHGLGVAAYKYHRTKHWPNMNTLSLPAGPGFAVGTIITGIIMLHTFPTEFLL